jgi:hypothetical protein
MGRGVCLSVLALALAASFALAGCVRPLRMCTAEADCGSLSSCVAGRCIARSAVPAIAAARRVVYAPVAIGYVGPEATASPREGDDSAPPAVVTLGGGARGGARAFLRFSVPLAPEATVVEAYVLIDRVGSLDADPAPTALHLVEVVDRWDPASLSWAVQPRVEELGSPVTRVLPSAGAVVRIDARLLVEKWRRRRPSDELGVAIVGTTEGVEGGAANGSSRPPAGMAFALAPRASLESAPRLELYVR